MKRIKMKGLLMILGLLLATLVVLLTARFADRNYTANVGDEGKEELVLTDSTINIEHTVFSEDVYLINELARDYIMQKGEVTINSLRDKYQYGETRLDGDLPVHIWYKIKGLPFGCSVTSAVLEVSEDLKYSNPRKFQMESSESFIDVNLLKTNTTYFYRITLELSDGTVTGVTGQFKTANTPRMLNVDGVMNMRDIGGWTTMDGNTIRQGLLYRGAELDGEVKSEYVITESGVNQMLHVLGIRTEMDLRGKSLTTIPADTLGKDVKHVIYNIPTYVDVLQKANNEAMLNIFTDLANADNYPIYLHDTYGLDQTGTVCYLLGGLLGMKEEDLMIDYRLSILGLGGLNYEDMTEFVFSLQKYDGATTQAKVQNYLTSIGVTAEQIASIRQIFLEAPKTPAK